MQTVLVTEELIDHAKKAETPLERDTILKEQSLRSVCVSLLVDFQQLELTYPRSIFLHIIPGIHSIYKAVVADPLHQIE